MTWTGRSLGRQGRTNTLGRPSGPEMVPRGSNWAAVLFGVGWAPLRQHKVTRKTHVPQVASAIVVLIDVGPTISEKTFGAGE